MTFKHIKFEDSVVMRSLEKLYKEKGLIKEEPLKKEASSKLDLRASSNLMENILKLCTGLRSYGLDKQANELESNYLSYKKANTLYETSKETGEDLINAAHPKGSHKVDVLGDDLAVVETILDRHLKMIKIVDKVPTGKLASSKLIINAVKNVLAEDYITNSNEKFKEAVNAMITLCNQVNIAEDTSELSAPRGLVGFRGFYYTSRFGVASIERHLNAMIDNLKDELSKPANASYIEEHMRGYIKAFNYLIRTANAITNKDLYLNRAQVINNLFTLVKETIQHGVQSADKPVSTDSATTIVSKENVTNKDSGAIKPNSVVLDASQILLQKFQVSINNIGLYNAIVNAKNLQNKEKLSEWLNSMAIYLDKKFKELDSSKYKNNTDILSSYSQKLEAANFKLDEFKQKWLS